MYILNQKTEVKQRHSVVYARLEWWDLPLRAMHHAQSCPSVEIDEKYILLLLIIIHFFWFHQEEELTHRSSLCHYVWIIIASVFCVFFVFYSIGLNFLSFYHPQFCPVIGLNYLINAVRLNFLGDWHSFRSGSMRVFPYGLRRPENIAVPGLELVVEGPNIPRIFNPGNKFARWDSSRG